jgi:hypothetical protein
LFDKKVITCDEEQIVDIALCADRIADKLLKLSFQRCMYFLTIKLNDFDEFWLTHLSFLGLHAQKLLQQLSP